MEFFVYGKDGSKFGPADLQTLNEWAQEGRVLPETVLERVSDGAKGPAAKLPGMVFPESSISAPPVMPGQTAVSVPTPTAPVRSTSVQFKEPDYAPPPREPMQYPPAAAQGPYASSIAGYTPAQESAVINRFNWGAFFLTWIWGLNHRAYGTLWILAPWPTFLLLVLINYWVARGAGFYLIPPSAGPFIFIIWVVLVGALHIWYGAKGNEWAWASGRFGTPTECQKAQNAWGAIGGAVVGSIAFVFFLFAAAARYQATRRPAMSSPTFTAGPPVDLGDDFPSAPSIGDRSNSGPSRINTEPSEDFKKFVEDNKKRHEEFMRKVEEQRRESERRSTGGRL